MQSAAWCAESVEVKVRVLECGRSTGVQYRELLQLLLQATHRPSTEARQALSSSSRKIATCVTDLVAAAESLKGISILNHNSCPTNSILSLFLETKFYFFRDKFFFLFLHFSIFAIALENWNHVFVFHGFRVPCCNMFVPCVGLGGGLFWEKFGFKDLFAVTLFFSNLTLD